jgi:outer membrane immunogenic protein
MTTRTFIAAAALLPAALAFAAPASAQETRSWTGPYGGVRVGIATNKGGDNETILFDTNLDGNFNETVTTGTGANAFSPGFCGGRARGATAAMGCRSDEEGYDIAAHLGYDVQLGSSFVVGIVGEYGRSDISDSVSAFSTTPAFYTMTRRLRDNGSLRLRAGVAFGDTLVYGTGGVAYGKIRNSFTTSNTANTFTNTGNEDAWGYRVGGGVEERIARNLSLGLQYAYTSLETDEFQVRAGAPAPAGNPFIRTNPMGTDFARSDDKFDTHSLSLTMSLRF